ncbi:unnamed protein product [Timema podura]|uniref:Ras-associating domain-containing protein n=1 Tax=Timema podura TaxID=61482 RepID=A0ABN7NKP2_TIMPD|nr:unnamed protein product [Timema podura]
MPAQSAHSALHSWVSLQVPLIKYLRDISVGVPFTSTDENDFHTFVNVQHGPHIRQCFNMSQYKSLLISDRTTVDELIQILLSCYNSKEQVEQFSLYEVCKSQEYQRKLHPDDCPLQVQQCWGFPIRVPFPH